MRKTIYSVRKALEIVKAELLNKLSHPGLIRRARPGVPDRRSENGLLGRGLGLESVKYSGRDSARCNAVTPHSVAKGA